MRENLYLFRVLLKLAFPSYIVLLPIVAIYGHVTSWGPAEQALSVYQDQFPLMVGFRYRGFKNQQGTRDYISRSYILLPSVFSEPKTVKISQVNNEEPIVTTNRYGFLLVVGWLVICILGTWWFWFRPKKVAQRSAQPDGPASGAKSG